MMRLFPPLMAQTTSPLPRLVRNLTARAMEPIPVRKQQRQSSITSKVCLNTFQVLFAWGLNSHLREYLVVGRLCQPFLCNVLNCSAHLLFTKSCFMKCLLSNWQLELFAALHLYVPLIFLTRLKNLAFANFSQFASLVWPAISSPPHTFTVN